MANTDTLPVGEGASELATILCKAPAGCTAHEKKTFQQFVDIGLTALDRRLSGPLMAKDAFMEVTASDKAWAIANFRHYATEDTPLEDATNQPRRTARGNESVRIHKRQKIAGTAGRLATIMLDCQDTTEELVSWEKATDIKNDNDREEAVKERLAIRTAWAEHLQEVLRDTLEDRENVAPGNGGSRVAVERNPYASMQIDLEDFPTAAV